jgi:plasmid stabilization system protein ParE
VRIQILAGAREDLRYGYRYYEDRSPGLGGYFRSSLFADIESLGQYAGVHRIVHGSHRCLSKRFPFAIYYKVDGELVRVIAVLDCRRDPSWIKQRLGGT